MSILFDFHDDLVVEEMNFPWTDPSITAIKAGTPLDEDGAIANNGDAVGLVAYTLPHGGDNLLGVASSNADGSLYIKVKVIKSGYVNLAEVEASFGSALTDACKSALTGIHFITDISSGGGGGGGGNGIFVIELNAVGNTFYFNKTYAEIKTAITGGLLPVVFTNVGIGYVLEYQDGGGGSSYVVGVLNNMMGGDPIVIPFACDNASEYPSYGLG